MGFRTRVFVMLASAVVVLVAGLSVAPALMPDNPVHVIPGNIAHRDNHCDSSLPDVSAQMQKWLDSLPNHSVAELGVNQCYRLELPVTIGAKTNVVFDGRGSTFASLTDGCAGRPIGKSRFTNCQFPSPDPRKAEDWPVDRYHLRVAGNKNVTVKNLRIEGGKNKPGYDGAYEFQHGIVITGNDDGVVLDNVSIDHVWGDYVAITPHIHSQGDDHVKVVPHNITIQNSHFGLDRNFMGSGRMGISIQEGEHIFIHDNVIRYSSRSAVDIEPVSSGATLRDIHVVHNTFGPHGLNLFANRGYGHADPVIDGVSFRDNTLTGTPLQVYSVANISDINAHDPTTFRRHHYEFVNNVSDTGLGNSSCTNAGHEVMRLWGIDGIVIDHNIQPVQAGRCMTLIDAARVANTTVTYNTVKNASGTADRYYQSFNDYEQGNLIGNPTYPAPLTTGAVAHPITP
jgi:hypothetical protein